MAEYNELSTGRIQVFIDLWSGVFTRLYGDILEISVFMQTNDSNDAPPIVGTSYGPIFQDRHSGMDCRNPGSMDGLELAIHGAGYPLPGGYDELAHNLTK